MLSNMDTIPTTCWLDPRVTVRPSPIHGRGLFAVAAIGAGEVVKVFGGTVVTDAQVQAIIQRGDRYDGIGLGPDQNLLIDSSWPGVDGNHSCDPNLWMRDAVTFTARRPILAGEELTTDYAMFTAIAAWSLACRCGTSLCRGLATGSDWRREDLQVRYRGHFAPFINDLIDQHASRPSNEPSNGRADPA